ncbi:MAG: zinc finger domain-containing protein [Thermoplasmata archaeon]
MEEVEVCNSCGNKLVYTGSTTFPCPSCGNTTIGRCPTCRDQSVVYKCKQCGFSGP